MRKIVFLFLCLALISSCRMDVNFSDGNDVIFNDSHCWMEGLSDGLLLRSIAIPGTHDSCANYDFLSLSSTAAAQDLDVRTQLESGVRYLDVRPCFIDGEIRIHHGPTYQHLLLSDVIDIVKSFLSENPSETVLLAILPEYRSERSWDEISQYLRQFLTDPSWVIPTEKDQARGLTLGDCRGKIVLLSRTNCVLDENRLECHYTKDYTETGAPWRTHDLEDQWNNWIVPALERMESTPSVLTALYTAGYFEGQFGIPNIRMASSVINVRLESYLESHDISSIVVCDHITRRLANRIYSRNF